MRLLERILILSAGIGLTTAIIRNVGLSNSTTTTTTIGPTTNSERHLSKADRKSDYVGAASYDYGSYAYPDVKYGGGGVGGYPPYDPLKGLLVPLAGVALLGAAALFASNPVLLQLGVIGGRRRRREIEEIDRPAAMNRLQSIHALETFIEQLPPPQVSKQEKKLVASYIKCSSSFEGSRCLERLACEIQKPSGNTTDLERQVLDIVTGEIMKNEYIPKNLKQKIKKAEAFGTGGGKCERYFCSEVDALAGN